MDNAQLVKVIKKLISACNELFRELGGKDADWGVINDAMIAGEKVVNKKGTIKGK